MLSDKELFPCDIHRDSQESDQSGNIRREVEATLQFDGRCADRNGKIEKSEQKKDGPGV